MLNDRLDELLESPFVRLTALLDAARPAANLEPISLAVGEPKMPSPPMLAETVAEEAATWNRYAPAAGIPDLQAAQLAYLHRRYRLPDGFVTGKNVFPSPGSRQPLFMTALITVPSAKAGQRPAVLMPNPLYHAYYGAAVAAGGEPVPMTATAETGFLPDLDALAPDLLERTALMYLCTPSNPQGAVADTAYIRRALALARRHDFALAVDECYAEIWNDAPPPGGLEAAAETGRLDNLLVFHSLSKRSSSPGMRGGFIAGDARLIAAMAKLVNYGGAVMPEPVQSAAARLWSDDAHVEEVRAFYRRNFDVAEKMLGHLPGFQRPGGGFFLWLDVQAATGEDGEAICRRLWEEVAIRSLPGGYVSLPDPDGSNPGARYLRLALVYDQAVTEEALGRVARVVQG